MILTRHKRLCFLHQFERPHGLAASYNPLTYLDIVAYKQVKKVLFVLYESQGILKPPRAGIIGKINRL